MSDLLLLPPTTPFRPKGNFFKKEVLRAGTYQHPVEPWDDPLVLDNDDIEELAANSNAAIAAGVKTWVPKTHSRDPEDNRGYVTKFFTEDSKREPGKRALMALVDLRNPETAEQIRRGEIEDVSVGLDEYGDHRGTKFGPRIEHVALVPDPVFAGQDSFVALSRSRSKNPRDFKALVHRSHAMSRRLSRKFRGTPALGLAAPPPPKRRLSVSAPARKVAKTLGIEAPESGRFTQETFDAFCESVLEKMSGGASGEPVAIKALSRNADATFAELQTEREAKIATDVTALVKSGRVPAAVEADVKTLLSVRHGYALSAKGEASAVDVRATLSKVLNAIPENACVDLKERIKALSLAPGQPPAAPGDFDAGAEVTKRLSALKKVGVKVKE